VSVRKKIASLCAADVALKEFAQRAVESFEFCDYIVNLFTSFVILVCSALIEQMVTILP